MVYAAPATLTSEARIAFTFMAAPRVTVLILQVLHRVPGSKILLSTEDTETPYLVHNPTRRIIVPQYYLLPLQYLIEAEKTYFTATLVRDLFPHLSPFIHAHPLARAIQQLLRYRHALQSMLKIEVGQDQKAGINAPALLLVTTRRDRILRGALIHVIR